MQNEAHIYTESPVSTKILWAFAWSSFKMLARCIYSDNPDMQWFFLIQPSEHIKLSLTCFFSPRYEYKYVCNSQSIDSKDHNSYLLWHYSAFPAYFPPLISDHNPTPNRITGGQGCKALLNKLILWTTTASGLAGWKREIKPPPQNKMDLGFKSKIRKGIPSKMKEIGGSIVYV